MKNAGDKDCLLHGKLYHGKIPFKTKRRKKEAYDHGYDNDTEDTGRPCGT